MPEPKLTEQQKKEVARRAKQCCEYCQSQVRFSPDPFSVEHIIPRSRGGTDDLSNLAFSCQGCNNHKYTSVEAIDPISGETVQLFDPRRQKWNDHFVWNADQRIVLGLTPVGRATVQKLRLNRAGLMNLRRVLHRIGEHPVLKGVS